MASTHMKLPYPRSKSNSLDIFHLLSEVNDSPVFTHAVALIISTEAYWHWQRDQCGWGWKVIAEVVRSHENNYHKNILSSLRHLSCQRGRVLVFSKIILIGGILAATHKIGQKMTKFSRTYAHSYAPPPPAPICCTVRLCKEKYIQLRWTFLRPGFRGLWRQRRTRQ